MTRRGRKSVGFSISETLADRLKKASDESMIPQVRIVEKGIEMMLAQMGHAPKENRKWTIPKEA